MAIKGVVNRAGVDSALIEEVYFGCAKNQAGEDNATLRAWHCSGACVMVLMSATKAEELGIRPMARWIASAAAGVDPRDHGDWPSLRRAEGTDACIPFHRRD